jgi:hypothetical protein
MTPAGRPDVQLEATTGIEVGSVQVLAGFRTPAREALAGGPLDIEFFIENRGQEPFCFAFGTDRARRRPALFSLTAYPGGSSDHLDDPRASIPELGGPMGIRRLAPGEPFTQKLIAGQFICLEQLRDIVAPGEAQLVTVRCRRPLPAASDEAAALQPRSHTPTVDATLRIHVRRDDHALAHCIAALAEQARPRHPLPPAPDWEHAVATLCTLRVPEARPHLQALLDHPDPATRTMAEQALAALERQSH